MNFAHLFIIFTCLFNIGLIESMMKKWQIMNLGCRECGIGAQIVADHMIVKGNKVKDTEKYPWMVALMEVPSRRVFCGGAILNEYFILTAAHCIVKYVSQSQRYISDYFGTTTERVFPSYLRRRVFRVGFLTHTSKPRDGAEVAQIIPHPGYKHPTFINDIALLKLKKPIQCNELARPICLPGRNLRIQIGNIFGITGWGAESGRGASAKQTLKEARIVLHPAEKCSSVQYYTQNSRQSLCLTGYNGGTPCDGDSGGSMFTLQGGRYYTIGVASTAVEPPERHCVSKAGVVLYTSVQPFMPWIQKITGIYPRSIPPYRYIMPRPYGGKIQLW